jgi:hypothetical protein
MRAAFALRARKFAHEVIEMMDRSDAAAPSTPPLSGVATKGGGRYEILACLGQGGMGIVYESFDRHRQERIALKTLRHFDAAGLYHFKQEFRTLADVLHRNLVQLYELVADDSDDVFFTMELVDGTEFLNHVRRASKIPSVRPSANGRSERSRSRPPCQADFSRLRAALLQLVGGVNALHAAGRLHRDLKPSNIRVARDGRVVILDFGVATQLGRTASRETERTIVGTAAYMAPEQAAGDEPAPASDWYSVGAILYEALVGVPPFDGSAVQILTEKCTVDAAPPSARVWGVPDDLDALCADLLSYEPAQRPTAEEILRRLGGTASDHAPRPHLEPGSGTPIGRDKQLATLHEAFAHALRGCGVSVRVIGAAGMGKSAVVQHFLNAIESDGDVLVLRGRAYERESMPYKAVDSAIDALSRHLVDLEQQGSIPASPTDAWALAQVFPVLRRVESIARSESAKGDDPRTLRQRAFGALRELFAALSRRSPIVFYIDDVQWGDPDSAALVAELTRPPDAPPFLLLTTHRTEEADRSPFLTELAARWDEGAATRIVEVGPLDPADARRLAAHWLQSGEQAAQDVAEAIARESGGSPFLIEELAGTESGVHRIAAGATPILERMLAERAAGLSSDARQMLEIIAVGGRPMPVTTVRDACAADNSVHQLLTLLRSRRLVRMGMRNGVEVVEACHDRVRATIVSTLSVEVARRHHAQLARVLEATADADPEAITVHLLGAGDRERAAHHAERAAMLAIEKLAFAQAARFFQLTLDTMDPSSPTCGPLRRRMAEALEWAGHPEKAARAYLMAAEGATGLQRLDLERAAAAQLVAAGRIDEGFAACRRVLASVGRALPGSVWAIVFWVTVYRFVAILLARSSVREVDDLSPEDRLRLTALHIVSRVMAVIDPVSTYYVKARYLADALRSGNRPHIVRAAATEASTLSAYGRKESQRERRLYAMARRMAEESGDKEGLGLYELNYGIGQYLRGRFRVGVEHLDAAREQLVALRRWQANASLYRLYALAFLGELGEVKSQGTRLLADAERRGDRYIASNLRCSHAMAAWIATDDVEGARKHLAQSTADWAQANFLVQHSHRMVWEAEVELYSGEGERAWIRLAQDEAALERSCLLEIHMIRSMTFWVRGRSAVASLGSARGSTRGARLAVARQAQRLLEREAMPWTDALAAALESSIAMARQDAGSAEIALNRAIDLAETAEMAVHAAAARHRLGSLLGGDRGTALVTNAEEAMRARGVRMPAQYARTLVP